MTFILTILYFRIDQPIVYALRSHAEAGWYGLAYKPFEALLFVPMTLLSVVFPALSIYHRDRPAQMVDAVGKFFKALFVIGWPMSVGIFVLAHPLTHSLQLYDQSEPALRILALGLAIGFANNAFIGALSASDHQSSFTWAAGWSLLANVALNLALIPTFGYIGASWATVATEIVLGGVAWYLTARHIGRVPVFKGFARRGFNPLAINKIPINLGIPARQTGRGAYRLGRHKCLLYGTLRNESSNLPCYNPIGGAASEPSSHVVETKRCHHDPRKQV